MDLTNKMHKYYVDNYMEIQEWFLSLRDTYVLIKISGLMMWHARGLKTGLQIVHIVDGEFIIVIQQENVFKYSVVGEVYNHQQLWHNLHKEYLV